MNNNNRAACASTRFGGIKWSAEGGGYSGESINNWIYSISRFSGPVALSRHNGDGKWENCGSYESPAHAVAAAEYMDGRDAMIRNALNG